eukprot:CAMPEP_0119046128 /NCGR_PEP_ID=MMETSP1177-20130426/44578_1 /TAXON_ID=2985 /ORGANISM="Ochromonas sp, Strain CCMP1899" /LENGTH=116 /DNA_ID=CAMNT_0007018837 /DNA_START=354 /DNA_END=704 /DNA_ORIENTATION=+
MDRAFGIYTIGHKGSLEDPMGCPSILAKSSGSTSSYTCKAAPYSLLPDVLVRTNVKLVGGRSIELSFNSLGNKQGAIKSGISMSAYSFSGGQQLRTVGLNETSSGVTNLKASSLFN